jgi:hypothetical protein
VSDRLVEPAELGQRVGEVGPGERRQVGGEPSEPLVGQVALDARGVLLEEAGCLAKLAPGVVRNTELAGCLHLDGAIAECLGDGQGLARAPEGLAIVAGVHVLGRHKGGDPSEPAPVAQ